MNPVQMQRPVCIVSLERRSMINNLYLLWNYPCGCSAEVELGLSKLPLPQLPLGQGSLLLVPRSDVLLDDCGGIHLVCHFNLLSGLLRLLRNACSLRSIPRLEML